MMKSLTNLRAGRKAGRVRSRNLLGTLWGGLPSRRTSQSPGGVFPALGGLEGLDVSEDDKEVRVRLEAPGLSEKDLEITYAEGVLRIRGEKTEEREDRKRDMHYRESRYGSFWRTVPVGTGVDWEKARARFRKGTLEVTLPKKSGDPSRKRLIPVG